MHLFVAAASEKGQGVNVLPIALFVILVAVGIYLWKRSRDGVDR